MNWCVSKFTLTVDAFDNSVINIAYVIKCALFDTVVASNTIISIYVTQQLALCIKEIFGRVDRNIISMVCQGT